MSRNNSTMITPSRERGQHLKFEDRVSIKIYRKLKYTLRAIADVLDCSPSTIMYEIKRGTGERNGSRGRFPEYNPSRGQANYEVNRSRCHRKAKALNGNPFVDSIPEKPSYLSFFLIPACLSVMAGLFVCRNGKQISNSSRLVVFSWFYGILLAAAPFLMYGDVTPVQALFESVSGFTTTGLSVLDVEKLPHTFLFYRAFLQYVGGLGFVMTMLLFVQGDVRIKIEQVKMRISHSPNRGIIETGGISPWQTILTSNLSWMQSSTTRNMRSLG